MAHKRTDWLDHVVEHPHTYTETVNQDQTITLAAAPGEIIQQGTSLSATNLNSMEDGIGDVAVSLDVLIQYVMMKLSRSNYTLDGLDAAKLDLHATADKADKLATARKVGITGKATGAGVNFDGSSAINIEVTALDPTGLSEAVAIGKGGTGASTALEARRNLEAVSQMDYDTYKTDRAKELLALIVAVDVADSIHQAEARAQEKRIATLEAQVAALT